MVPKGLADDFTLPPTWGVIELTDNGLRQKLRAQKLDRTDPTVGFLCAMLRGRERLMLDAASKVSKDREEQIRRDAIWGAKNSEEELKRLQEKLASIKDATGISLDNWTPPARIIERLKAADSLELITRNIRFIGKSADSLLQDIQEVKDAADMLCGMKGEVEN